MALPCQPDRQHEASMAHLSIQQVLQFDSHSLKSGVVVTSDETPAGWALLFIKDAPKAVRDTVEAASVPSNFDQAR